jgi:hypothetical protein
MKIRLGRSIVMIASQQPSCDPNQEIGDVLLWALKLGERGNKDRGFGTGGAAGGGTRNDRAQGQRDPPDPPWKMLRGDPPRGSPQGMPPGVPFPPGGFPGRSAQGISPGDPARGSLQRFGSGGSLGRALPRGTPRGNPGVPPLGRPPQEPPHRGPRALELFSRPTPFSHSPVLNPRKPDDPNRQLFIKGDWTFYMDEKNTVSAHSEKFSEK